MSFSWTFLADWMGRGLTAGGLLLLVTSGLMHYTRQPARRQRLAEIGVLAALLAVAVSLGPRWLVLPSPLTVDRAEPAVQSAPPGAINPEPAPQFTGEPVFWDEAIPFEFVEVAPIAEPDVTTTFSEPHNGWATLTDFLPGALTILFLGGAILFLLRWVIGMVALARLLRDGRPASAQVQALLAEIADDAEHIRVLTAPRLRTPISCGLFRPTIVLPASFCGNAERRLRWVLAHEVTHLRRGDAWSSLLVTLGQCVFFLLPWFWFLRRQVRLCQEYVADAAAIRCVQGPAPADYAEFLLSLAKVPAVPRGATGVSGHRSDLYRRLTMLLQNPMRVEQHCSNRWLALAGIGFAAAAILLGGINVAPAAEETTPVVQPQPVPQAVPQPPAVPGVPAVQPAVPVQPAPLVIKVVAPAPVLPAQAVKIVAIPQPAIVAAPPVFAQAGKPAEPVTPKTPGTPGATEPGKRADAAAAIEELERALRELGKAPSPQEAERVREQIEKAIRQLHGMKRPGPGFFVPNIDVEVRPFFPDAPGFAFRPAPFDRGRLGVSVDRPSDILADQLDLPKGEGLIITDVVPKSVAEKAGLKTNDILLEVNKKAVKSDPGEFARSIMEMKADAQFDVVVLRKGKKMTVKGIALPEVQRPEPPRPPFGPEFEFRFRPGTVTTTVMRDKDSFTANHREGKTSIRVTGKFEDGKVKVERIVVQDGPQSQSYDSVDAVPAEHRDRVNRLVEMSRNTAAKDEKK